MKENERSERVEAIFAQAVDLPEKDRPSFLAGACGDDEQLRERVEKLLAAETRMAEFMSEPTVKLDEAPGSARLGEGSVIGPYKLLEQIGEGGFGVVYMAEQQTPVVRKVAFKIIKLGMDTRSVIARFEAERQALALMDHPNIAKVLDAGATDHGRPYFVMDLVRGIPITEFCDENNLSTEERLNLFCDVCSAVQHAHQKGIIHRDLKPNNILVTMNGDQPLPKVIDFGIAKATQGRLTDKTLFTQFQQLIGTPAYMSPEQAQMSAVDVDTRSDIYSLGVLLYELLTGQPPFDPKDLLSGSFEEIRRRIREEDPPKPSTRVSTMTHAERTTAAKHRKAEPEKLGRLIRGELDWIVMKAMEKERTRRYETANGLSMDVKRFLGNEIVTAVAPSTGYRLRKLARRNKGALAAAAVVIAALVLGTTVSTWQAIRATRANTQARVEAERARAAESQAIEQHELAVEAGEESRAAQARAEASEWEAKRNLYVSEVATAKREFDALNTMGALDLLNMHVPRPGEPDFRGFEWRWLWNQCHDELFALHGHTKLLRAMNFSRDGRLLATGATDGTVRLWDIETQREIWHYKGGEHCNRAEFSPDGKWLLTSFYRPTSDGPEGTVLWDVSDPESPREVSRFENWGAFAPDGSTFWNGGRQYNLSGELIREVHPSGSTGQALSEDGEFSVWLDWVGNGFIADLRSGDVATLPKHVGYFDIPVKGTAISPVDEDVIVTGSLRGARIWNRSGELIHELPGTAGSPVSMIRFSKNGDLLAVRMFAGAIKIFETESWTQVAVVRTPQPGNTVAFSPTDNTLILAGGDDGVIRGWRVKPNAPIDTVLHHPQPVDCMEFSPDGEFLAVGMYDGSVRFWDLRTNSELFSTLPKREVFATLGLGNVLDIVALSPDGAFAAIIGPESTVSVWDIRRREEVQRSTLPEPDRYRALVFSTDGKRLYAAKRTGGIEVFEWDGRVPRLAKVSEFENRGNPSLAVSPDGQFLASPSEESTILLSLTGYNSNQELPESMEVSSLAFSPDGTWLAGGAEGPGTFVWETASGEVFRRLPSLPSVRCLSWNVDGTRLATSAITGETKLWAVAAQQVVATFVGRACAFSPDGAILAIGGDDMYSVDAEALRRVTLYSAPPIAEIDRRRAQDIVDP